MSEPVENAADIGAEDLREGSIKWAAVDAPWLQVVDRAIFSKELNRVRELAPQMILSNHLPPAADMTELLLAHLPAVPDSLPFVGLDQPGLESMLKGGHSR